MSSPEMSPATEYSQYPYHDLPPSFSRKRTQSTVSSSSGSLCLEMPATSRAYFATLPNQAHGAFTPTSSAFHSLRHIADSAKGSSMLSKLSGRRRRGTPAHLVWRLDYEPVSQSEPTTAASSPTPYSSQNVVIPSISRTAPFTPSGETSPTGSFSVFFDHDHTKPARTINLKDVDALVKLEKRSKFCKRREQCAGCGKLGSEYPSCSKCGDKWCSRECRLHGPGGNGKRHICGISRTDSSDSSMDSHF